MPRCHPISWLFVFLLFGGFMLSAAPFATPAVAQSVVTSIPVGSNPNGAAYDSAKGEVFISNSISNSVSVISDSANTVVATLQVGLNPTGGTYDSSKGEVFIANANSNTVSVISDTTDTIAATVTVKANPTRLGYDSAKGEIFVASSNSDTVSVISDINNTVVATVSMNHPAGVAYDPVKGEIFVTNFLSNTVSVISDTNNNVVATVPIGMHPNEIAYDSSKGEVFAANSLSNTVSVISDATNKVVASVSVGTSPFGVAYDSSKREVFVTNSNSGTVSVISDSSNTAIATVGVGAGPTEDVFDSAKGEVFVANSGSGTASVISDGGTQPCPGTLSQSVSSSYPTGAPASSPNLHYSSCGTYTRTPLTAAVHSIKVDQNSIMYPDASIGGSSTTQYSSYPVTFGAVGIWPLCEQTGSSAFDLANGNTGSLQVSPKWIDGGKCGLTFSGKSWVNASDDTLPSRNQSRTIAIKFTISNSPGYDPILVYYGNSGRGGADPAYLLFCNGYCNGPTNNNHSLCLGSWGGGDKPCTPYSLNLNQEYCSVATYNGTAADLYVNGLLVGSASRTYDTTLTGKLYIGGAQSNYLWQGNISSVAIYSRALSPAEASEWCSTSSPDAEVKATSGASASSFTYYYQLLSLVANKSTYKSFGQTLTAHASGQYWVDNVPVTSPTTTSGGGGGIPEFPYQLLASTVLVILLLASYLMVRRQPHGKYRHWVSWAPRW